MATASFNWHFQPTCFKSVNAHDSNKQYMGFQERDNLVCPDQFNSAFSHSYTLKPTIFFSIIHSHHVQLFLNRVQSCFERLVRHIPIMVFHHKVSFTVKFAIKFTWLTLDEACWWRTFLCPHNLARADELQITLRRGQPRSRQTWNHFPDREY